MIYTPGRSLPVCIGLGNSTLFKVTKTNQYRENRQVKTEILTEYAVHQVYHEDENLCEGHALVEIHRSSHFGHDFREDHSALK
jgi:hypothetical protein